VAEIHRRYRILSARYNLHVLISPRDVEEFDLVIALACRFQSEERLEFNLPPGFQANHQIIPLYFYRKDECLVLSFDGSWYPFLDNTRGLNRGPQRWYVPKKSWLLAQVGIAMQSPEQRRLSGSRSGGRIFLHSLGALRSPAMSAEIELIRWQLPRESSFLRNRRT